MHSLDIMLIVFFVCIAQIQGISIGSESRHSCQHPSKFTETEIFKTERFKKMTYNDLPSLNDFRKRRLSIFNIISSNLERNKRNIANTGSTTPHMQTTHDGNFTGTTDSMTPATKRKSLAPMFVGFIIGGTIVCGAFIGFLIYLKMKKSDDNVSTVSSTDHFILPARRRDQRTRESHSMVDKKRNSDLGSGEDDKKKKPKVTMADLVLQKRHKEFVNARNKEHAEDAKSTRFQKKKTIFVPKKIDDDVFVEEGKSPEVKLDKVFYNYKENEVYDSDFDIEEIDLEPSAPIPSSAISFPPAHLSLKRDKTKKSTKTAKEKKSSPRPQAEVSPVQNRASAPPNRNAPEVITPPLSTPPQFDRSVLPTQPLSEPIEPINKPQ